MFEKKKKGESGMGKTTFLQTLFGIKLEKRDQTIKEHTKEIKVYHECCNNDFLKSKFCSSYLDLIF